MCGRFNVLSDPLSQLLMKLTGQEIKLSSRLNIAPTEDITVVHRTDKNKWQPDTMRWWLTPQWAKESTSKYAMFNARIENIMESKAYRRPFQSQRCVIPGSGYYEWKTENSVKHPYYIEPAEDIGFLFAGVWDHWKSSEGNDLFSCAMITRPACTSMKGLHNRQPAILSLPEAEEWCAENSDLDRLEQLVIGEKGIGVKVTEVDTWVNNARHKDSRCLAFCGVPSIHAV